MSQVEEIMARLVCARRNAGLSQSQASRLLGFSGTASSLSQHETGRSIPTLDLFLRMCAVYGVSPVWALTGINPEFDVSDFLIQAQTLGDDALKLVELLSMITGRVE